MNPSNLLALWWATWPTLPRQEGQCTIRNFEIALKSHTWTNNSEQVQCLMLSVFIYQWCSDDDNVWCKHALRSVFSFTACSGILSDFPSETQFYGEWKQRGLRSPCAQWTVAATWQWEVSLECMCLDEGWERVRDRGRGLFGLKNTVRPAHLTLTTVPCKV